jgi:3-deoxy-7-phosphoheptulonate synthase
MAGIGVLSELGATHGLPTVSEVMTPQDVPLLGERISLLQVGSRNMQNFSLLEALGKSPYPVLLKRGMGATVDEWLYAAEYLLSHGNRQVVLCERGIRTFEPRTRNTLDLSSVALAKRLTHLPVLVDPSHATGDRELVLPLALASAAAGADGIMVEIHPTPETALSDGPQALNFSAFETLMGRLRALLPALGRQLANSPKGDFTAR